MVKELLFKWFGLEELPCKSCEVLQRQLEIVNFEKKQLLETILEGNKPKIETVTIAPSEPIKPRNVSWAVKRQMLEQEDRKRAILEREKQEEIEKLEKEVGISNAS